MSRTFILATFLLLISVASTVLAQSPENQQKIYVQTHLLRYVNLEPNVMVGWQFHRRWGLELELGYNFTHGGTLKAGYILDPIRGRENFLGQPYFIYGFGSGYRVRSGIRLFLGDGSFLALKAGYLQAFTRLYSSSDYDFMQEHCSLVWDFLRAGTLSLHLGASTDRQKKWGLECMTGFGLRYGTKTTRGSGSGTGTWSYCNVNHYGTHEWDVIRRDQRYFVSTMHLDVGLFFMLDSDRFSK